MSNFSRLKLLNSHLPCSLPPRGSGTDYFMFDDQMKGRSNDASSKKSPVALEPVSHNQDLQVRDLQIYKVAL